MLQQNYGYHNHHGLYQVLAFQDQVVKPKIYYFTEQDRVVNGSGSDKVNSYRTEGQHTKKLGCFLNLILL